MTTRDTQCKGACGDGGGATGAGGSSGATVAGGHPPRGPSDENNHNNSDSDRRLRALLVLTHEELAEAMLEVQNERNGFSNRLMDMEKEMEHYRGLVILKDERISALTKKTSQPCADGDASGDANGDREGDAYGYPLGSGGDGGEGGRGAGRGREGRAAGGLPPEGPPEEIADADAPGKLLDPLLVGWRDVLVKHILKRLEPTDCAMLARVAKPWMVVVLDNNLLRVGGAGMPFKVKDFLRPVNLAWAKDNGCPWDPRVCELAAAGGNLAALRWAREHGCPWDSATCAAAAAGKALPSDAFHKYREVQHPVHHPAVLQWAREHGCPRWGVQWARDGSRRWEVGYAQYDMWEVRSDLRGARPSLRNWGFQRVHTGFRDHVRHPVYRFQCLLEFLNPEHLISVML